MREGQPLTPKLKVEFDTKNVSSKKVGSGSTIIATKASPADSISADTVELSLFRQIFVVS